MFTELYERLKVVEDMDDNKTKKAYFFDRTNAHIMRVQKAASAIVAEYPEYKELNVQVKVHDASKFKDPEIEPYIELTWLKKQDQKNDGDDQEAITAATLHHIKNNSHHPEYHLKDKSDANISGDDRDKSDKVVDATAMSDIDIAEMVADWQAMAEELQTGSALQWFNKQKDVRWHFSEEQEALIEKLCGVFDHEEE